MNIFAFISLLTFVSCILFGAFVYFKNRNALINKLYLFISLASASFAFIEFGYRQSRTYEEACFWWRLDFFWPLISVAIVYFVFGFIENKKLLKSKWTHLLVTLPAVLIVFEEMSLHLLYGRPVKQYWGWSYGELNPLEFGLLYTWIYGALLVPLVVLFGHYRTLVDGKKRNQVKLVLFGLSFTVVSSIAEALLNMLSIQTPPFNVISMLVCILVFGWAIWKYEMFALTPLTAAESIVTTMADSLLLISPDRTIASANKAAQKMLGYTEKELTGRRVEMIFGGDANLLPSLSRKTGELSLDKTIAYLETEFHTKNNGTVPVSVAGSVLHDEHDKTRGYLIIARDISERKKTDEELNKYRHHLEELVQARTAELTESYDQLEQETIERKKAEEARSELENQLQQAQKMEAIGRLAGGVAHDFNNLLFVIRGNTDSFLDSLPPSSPLLEEALEVKEAAERASDLTRQLLAFSRKQVVVPKVVDLKKNVEETKKILSRIIGEDVNLLFISELEAALIKIDPGQVNQILTNLVVNARDAMPDGGDLAIGLKQVSFDAQACRSNPEATEGDYIQLSVSDTGCGMDERMLTRIFEPFYTTKGAGKGTGLGLSTVYGIVKQNKGFIKVHSRPGQGTTFEIFLPCTSEATDEATQNVAVAPLPGNETILLVEDEDIVRKLANRLLTRQGYSVIEAKNAAEAIRLYKEHHNEIDLLLTDIVMPGMSGKQLYDRLVTTKPDLRALFMTGHTDELITRHGLLDERHTFIQKPFDGEELSRIVRQTLDA